VNTRVNLNWRDYITNKLLLQSVLPSLDQILICESIKIFKDLWAGLFTDRRQLI
jgi:hypothetical protein